MKKRLSLALLACIVSYVSLADVEVSEKDQVVAEVSLLEGPHVIYQQDKTLVLNGKPKNGQMVLETTSHSQLTQVKVYKGGEKPVTFTVPLKQQIANAAVTSPAPDKIFAMSDVEGNFNTVTHMFKTHGVIDNDLNWHFGKNQLVIIGDVFDRGNHVTELLWLLYRLETQAKAQGGAVHMVIGNHEMMNLQNDLRYVEPKYTAFAKLVAAQHHLSYAQLFDEHSELGRWLRSKNAVIKIGDYLFAHGGMSIAMLEQKLALSTINQTLRGAIDKPKTQRNELEKLLFGRNGPMWYRGYFMPLPNSPMINDQDLSKVLAFYNAKAIAVGHTIVDKPMSRYNGKVIAVDVKHPADHLITQPKRISYGVMIEGDKVFVVDEDGNKTPIKLDN